MLSLQSRSDNEELLDDETVPFDAIRKNMQELNTINRYLGGHAITISGVKKIIRQHALKNTITICEIGCGGGDNLLAIDKWCRKKNIQVNFIGIDIKPACIQFAQQQCASLNAQWITNDYLKADLTASKPDIIFSSLFCHHFEEPDLIIMMQWMKRHSSKGFFINDLHRHWLAYQSIRLLTSIFSKSYLVKNDAPLSVARGFKQVEWKAIFEKACIQHFILQWRWAFRHLIVYLHD